MKPRVTAAPPDGVTYQDIPHPDFVIVGAPLPGGGVALLASQHVTQATLRALAQQEIPLMAMTPGWMRSGVFLSLHAGIDDYVLVTGTDYADAFFNLFENWAPTPPKRPTLPGRIREIGSQIESTTEESG